MFVRSRAPTRAEFLTGRYHPRGGVRGVTSGGERLDLDEKTIAENFSRFRLCHGGVWQVAQRFPNFPTTRMRGFDEYYGFTSGHWGEYFNPPLEHNGKPVQGHGFITDDLTDHAIAFIQANKARRFFCYVPFNTPHSPMQVPDRFFDKFKDVALKLRAQGSGAGRPGDDSRRIALCENIDENVGRVLKDPRGAESGREDDRPLLFRQWTK